MFHGVQEFGWKQVPRREGCYVWKDMADPLAGYFISLVI